MRSPAKRQRRPHPIEPGPQLASATLPSPVGPLTLVAGTTGLVAVLWENEKPGRVPLDGTPGSETVPVLQMAKRQLTEYFNGKRQGFDLPCTATGTPFQTKVWKALSAIPYGSTRTYAQIARQIGRPRAVRAVGAAIGRNPLSILVPCHRVIGSNGKLTGFAGGLPRKEILLELERSGKSSAPSTGSIGPRNTT